MRPLPRPTPDLEAVVIRPSELADEPALSRLAGRDSKRAPASPVLVAEVDGELVAALPLGGGEAIADPFRPTAGLVSLLELRAAQLRGSDGSHRSGIRSPARAWVTRVAGRPAGC